MPPRRQRLPQHRKHHTGMSHPAVVAATSPPIPQIISQGDGYVYACIPRHPDAQGPGRVRRRIRYKHLPAWRRFELAFTLWPATEPERHVLAQIALEDVSTRDLADAAPAASDKSGDVLWFLNVMARARKPVLPSSRWMHDFQALFSLRHCDGDWPFGDAEDVLVLRPEARKGLVAAGVLEDDE